MPKPKAETKLARVVDLDARVSGPEQHGHAVTGRPPAECPSCAGGRPSGDEVHRIAGSDEELSARALALIDPDENLTGPQRARAAAAYVKGIRDAEANAVELAAQTGAQRPDVVEALAEAERDDEEDPADG